MKRSQGEIFGIALMFVIIIIGILVYAKIKALNPDRNEDLGQENEYKILAEGTLNTILDLSTGCYVERGKDRTRDIINYCLEYSFSGTDPIIECKGTTIQACKYSINSINTTLQTLFNDSGVGKIPFFMSINIPANPNSLLSNKTLTNFGKVQISDTIITEENYRKNNYKRAPSGIKTWATAQRNVEFELYLYYR